MLHAVEEQVVPDKAEGKKGSERRASMRSLTEVLGQTLVQPPPLDPRPSSLAPTDAELNELFGGLSEPGEQQGAPSLSAVSSASEAPAASAPSSTDPLRKLVDEKYGYARLGGVLPSDLPAGTSSLGLAHLPRLHPRRTFVPGQTYDAADLNAYAEPSQTGPRRLQGLRMMPTSAEVRSYADFKNVAFLQKFVTPAGRLLPRRRTKLPPHEHTLVMRQIKVARQLGFMAHEARLERPYLRGIRDAELRAAQEQGKI